MTVAKSSKLIAVVTTIQTPTAALVALSERLRELGADMVVAGDRKGPAGFELEGTRFLSLQDQLDGPFDLARRSPVGHYTRKNIAYLEAITGGAGVIYETDDDNAPLASWTSRTEETGALAVEEIGWVNAYRCFSSELIWPRGFPLDAIALSHRREPRLAASTTQARSPIQQGLANGSPDVDAIWRLVLDRPFDFNVGTSVRLPAGAWCPFNSQSTWWWPVAFPLLYLPSRCSFRMTDIWRSFVAQRCLWELDCGLVFHAAEVLQERNDHDLIRDFNDEVPGYQCNRELVRVLEAVTLARGESSVGDNLSRCYEALVAAGFFDATELELVASWRAGLEQARA